MRALFRFPFRRSVLNPNRIQQINSWRSELRDVSDETLRETGRRSKDLIETIAVTAVIAARVLGLVLFDVQLQGALALADGKIAEMQTGEGKTLAAVPAVVWHARQRQGVHVMTANDYLARRDAQWMGPIYGFLGLSVGCIQQGMNSEARRRAYACDVTYGTANEMGFDYLRDQLALCPNDQVHRPFNVSLVDEADSILIDEARLPLVIAGETDEPEALPYRVDALTRHFRRFVHYTVDENERNVVLTDAGIRTVENAFERDNLFDDENLSLNAAVQDSLHAHVLLHRDVDYIVKNDAIESVDEFKGRIIQDRRWPAGLHTAIEAKEGLAPKKQGRILGSVTLQHLMALYPVLCGMTGTAATQADEFRAVYGLDVEVIPTNRPMIRVDHPDLIFPTRREKDTAVIREICKVHQTGQPILVGTASVEESERLSKLLGNISHQVLNARHDEQEAAMIARAGERGSVTISTNMAGRGTDIKLGAGVAELGGLYVIGTNRHESRRIDNQLRGRAGRQGDPGSSRFFVSCEDPLLLRYGIDNPLYQNDPEGIQRLIEGKQLDIRLLLTKYERVTEGRRLAIQQRRQQLLDGTTVYATDSERLVRLTTIDDLWCEYLSALSELRSGVQWVALAGGGRDPLQEFWRLGGFDPFREYIQRVDALFEELLAAIETETAERLKVSEIAEVQPSRRGATWTYVTTDQPFGTWVQSALREYLKRRTAVAGERADAT
jgi:preprotein translocase subunit SecA